MSSIKKISELNLIDLEYRRQNDRIAENANRNRLGNVVKAPLNPIQNEMVSDFKAIYGKPKEIKDNAGNIIKYKLYEMPREEPKLDIHAKLIRTDEEIKNEFKKEIDLIHDEYPKIYDHDMKVIDEKYNMSKIAIENNIMNHNKEIKQLKNENIDNMLKLQILNDKLINTTDIGEIGLYKAEILDLNNKILLNNTDIDKNERDIEILKTKLVDEYNEYLKDKKDKDKELNAGYKKLQADTKEKELTSLNENEKYKEIDKQNLEVVNLYRNQLKELNTGMFNTEKQPNETNEEYFNRLYETAQEDYPEYLLEDAAFTITKELRIKLKEIISNPVDIDLIINSMDPLGKAEHQQMILKQFPLVKEEFIKLYGLNNKYVKPNDVLDFFKLFYTGENVNEKISKSNMKLTDAAKNNIITLKSIIGNREVVLTYNNKNKNQVGLYLRIFQDTFKFLQLLYSVENGVDGSFVQVTNDNVTAIAKIIEKATGISPYNLNVFFLGNAQPKAGIKYEEIARMLYDHFQLIPYNLNDVKVVKFIATKKGNIDIYGMGNEEYPKKVKFGDVFILLRKLYYDNLLSVVNSHSLQIRGFKMQKVSDAFTNIIINMINNISPKHTDINSLNDKEKLLFDRLISVSNLHKKIINNKESTIDKLKKRMKLIEGEIEIGNNNPDLINELHDILFSLKDYKIITLPQARQYLKQFK